MTKPENLHIQTVETDSLNPAEYNPRKHTEKQMRDLCESISRYGMVDPIIVNGAVGRKNIVIGGHFRLEAAKKLGYTKVPVIYLDIPDISREKELNLRLNQNTGEWDFEILKDFDIDLLLDVGFDNVELSGIWDGMLETEDDGFDVEKELESIGEPSSKLGEIYALGNHRLMCGDSTKKEDVTKLIGSLEGASGKIEMLYFDPPYNIDLDYNKGVGNGKKYGGFKTADNKSAEEYTKFLTCAIQNGLEHCSVDTHAFCYCDSNNIGLVQNVFIALKLTPRRVCLWIKNNINATPNIAFNKIYEPCVYANRGKPFLAEKQTSIHEIVNKEIGNGNQTLDDIYDMLDIWLAKRLPTQEYEHPTSKPPTLHERPLRRCTRANDIVLDLFGGSGSTLIACEQLKRRALIMEHEPIFIDLIIRRYEKLTGNKAVRLN